MQGGKEGERAESTCESTLTLQEVEGYINVHNLRRPRPRGSRCLKSKTVENAA